MLIEVEDFVFGISWFSFKFVYGGFCYFVIGDVVIVRESVVECYFLMMVIVLYLICFFGQLLFFSGDVMMCQCGVGVVGMVLGDLLWVKVWMLWIVFFCLYFVFIRMVMWFVLVFDLCGLRGGMFFYDGQLVDDVWLVVMVVCIVVVCGVCIFICVCVIIFCGDGVMVQDMMSGERFEVRVCVVVNVIGVWVGVFDGFIWVCLSCGIYFVFDVVDFGQLMIVLMILYEGLISWYVFVLFQVYGCVFVGFIDENVFGLVFCIVQFIEVEIDFLLCMFNWVL